MFKIEINVVGKTFHHYWMNKHKDDFIRFLPRIFTELHGELIDHSMIDIYKIDEAMKPLLEGKLNSNDFNCLCFSKNKIMVNRIHKSPFKDGDEVPLEYYMEQSKLREEIFKDTKENKDLKVKAPKTKKKTIDGAEVDFVVVDNTEDLFNDVESLELELSGELVSSNPYKKNEKKDSKGHFIHHDGLEFTGI